MPSSTRLLVSILLFLSLLALIRAIGFPTGGGGGCCCSPCGGGGGCCGGGGGCGCGRKKREAVMPHLKSSEVPCPQVEWRELMNESIVAGDPIASLTTIQSVLHGRFGGNKFLVNCASGGQQQQQPSSTAPAGEVANIGAEENGKSAGGGGDGLANVHFSSSGDGYCNVRKEDIWCQAVALQA